MVPDLHGLALETMESSNCERDRLANTNESKDFSNCSGVTFVPATCAALLGIHTHVLVAAQGLSMQAHPSHWLLFNTFLIHVDGTLHAARGWRCLLC